MRADYLTDPGTLRAIINVTQLYRETAYTYLKSCPKYVIGYGLGSVQILKGPCVYGGIRDLQASITTTVYNNDLNAYVFLISPENLKAIIGAHSPELLSGYIGGHSPKDIFATINGSLFNQISNITAKLISHNPANITACIEPYEPVSLSSTIDVHYPVDLQSYISTHQPITLSASLLVEYISTLLDLGGSIGSHYSGNLSSYLGGHIPGTLIAEILGKKPKEKVDLGATFKGTHSPVDVAAAVFTKQRSIYNIPAYIYGYDFSDLTAFVNIYRINDLSANIFPIISKNLSAQLKVYPQYFLPATVVVWAKKDLSANVKRIYSLDISATLLGQYPIYQNLKAMLKGVGSGTKDLSAEAFAYTKSDLLAYVKPLYLFNLPSFLRAVTPSNLKGLLHGWDEAFLPAEILGTKYPWELTANIYGRDSINNLIALINPQQGTATPLSLKATIHSWERLGLFACIAGDNSPTLSASLIPFGYSSDLHANLTPKIIRLTTVISIPTMEHYNLSAMINYPCFYTNFSNLSASLMTKYKADLNSFIRVMSFDYKPHNLNARTGFADSYSEVDKLKLRITLYPYEFMTEDKFKVNLHVLRSGGFITAYINVIPNSVDLTASVIADSIPSYNFTKALKNRERVLNISYSGHLRSYEVVEFAFKSIVEDYYYSSDGNMAWKSNRLDRWVLDVKSYLPQNLTLSLKRRLHKAAVLYDLSRFSSIDAAMRHVIAYVTEYPEGALTASINAAGYHDGLSASVIPIYVHNKTSGLSSIVIPSSPKIIVTSGDKIINI